VKQVNWGIIGLGAIATQFAKGFKNLNNSNLLAIASNNKEKLDKFKKDLNLNSDYCFNNYEALLENKEIDIIYIALPTSFHKEWIIRCIDRGKRVLVEKPATMNASEIEEIEKRYSKENIFLNEAFMYMYHPQIVKVIELINQGEIGELISMKSNFGMNILTKRNFFGFKKIKKLNKENRIFNKELGGGVILDIGCYPVSLSTLVASQISRIDYNKVKVVNIEKYMRPNEVEIDASMELVFENNFRSNVSASFTKKLGSKTNILGKKGEIVIENTWLNPLTITIKKEQAKIINFDSNLNLFSYEIEALSKCIIENKVKPDFPNLKIDDIVGNMKIIDKWKS